MKKKRVLDKRIRMLKKIEEDKESAQNKIRALEEKRENFLKTLFENPIRMEEVTQEVTDLIKKAERNPVAKLFLNVYRIPLREVAVVVVWDDKYIGEIYDCPGHNAWDSIFKYNDWRLRLRYLYGSPKDPVRLIFRKSGNERYYFCGLMANFPLK